MLTRLWIGQDFLRRKASNSVQSCFGCFLNGVANIFGDIVEIMVRCHRAVRVHDASVLQKTCELEVSRHNFLRPRGFVSNST